MNVSLTPFAERREDGQLRFFLIETPERLVGYVEQKGGRWLGWFLAAGAGGSGWCKERDVTYATEAEAADIVRRKINENCWYSG